MKRLAITWICVCVIATGWGCAYRWGGESPAAGSTDTLIVNIAHVENLTGVPGIEEELTEALIVAAREFPGLQIAAGSSGVPVTVVVKTAASDILVRDDLDRVVETRRRLVADVAVGDEQPVRIDTGDLAAGTGLELARRAGSAGIARNQAVAELAMAVLELVVIEGKN
ncbi:MAG: hypothetical protein JW909_02410 [Planctomycetes bacterium]|nr:hypothetical protein [Planctomycetota bacterium]